jgi:phenylalanyl-tRNA synthetase beta chain
VGGILRPTLLPSLLRAVARNRAVGAADVRLFELRTCFQARPEGVEAILAGEGGRPLDRTPVQEARTLAGVLVGRRSPPGWNSRDDSPVDFYDLMACVEAARAVVGWHDGARWVDGDAAAWLSFLDPNERASLSRGRESVGWAGRVSVPALRAVGLEVPVYAFELNISALTPRKAPKFTFQKLSRFPPAERDLAVVVADEHSGQKVLQLAERAAARGLKGAAAAVELFDVYRGKGIADGARSLALRFRFRAMDRTLEDKEVDAAMGRIEKALESQVGASVRR